MNEAARTSAPVPCPERFSLLLIAGSTGGPGALRALLVSLSPRFHAAVIVVQHMPIAATRRMTARLATQCALPVVAARGGMRLRPGRVHVAPGGLHVEIRHGRVLLSAAASEHGVRPAADVLFRSAWALAHEVVAVVLSGMGRDALEGARGLVARGATVLAQDEPSSVVWGMPGAVVRAGLATHVASPTELGLLLEAWGAPARGCQRPWASVKGSTPPGVEG